VDETSDVGLVPTDTRASVPAQGVAHGDWPPRMAANASVRKTRRAATRLWRPMHDPPFDGSGRGCNARGLSQINLLPLTLYSASGCYAPRYA
jgi:hypothetical protein